MRCPYCGGPNAEQARFCARCGRDMSPRKPDPRQQSVAPTPPVYTQPGQYQPPRQAQPSTPPVSPSSQSSSSYRQPNQYQPQPRPVPPATQPVATQARRRDVFVEPVLPPAPDAPAPFPSRTIEQLNALEQGALPYTVLDETVVNGRKKSVIIVYQRCASWQQVATLLKALRQYQTEKFETLIVQGVLEKHIGEYGFTNGQLRYDRNVPLGGQRINRYQIETGTGFEMDSVRIVLSE